MPISSPREWPRTVQLYGGPRDGDVVEVPLPFLRFQQAMTVTQYAAYEYMGKISNDGMEVFEFTGYGP